MSREIEFRAWDGKEMWDVHCVDFEKGEFLKLENSRAVSMQTYPEGDHWKNEIVLLQYTGLKEKNGKKIFEGDILGCLDEEDDSKYYIVFEDCAFRKYYTGWDESLTKPLLGDFDTKWFEVIGNIYENPDLLKSEN